VQTQGVIDDRDMDTGIDPRAHQVLADVSRVAVLETLRRAGRPLAVPEIAAEVGLHPNTVRAHLARLVEHGYASGGPEERERPGRPRLLYSATAAPRDDERRNYRLLAEALLAYLAGRDEDRGAAAVAAGRAYGELAIRRGRPLAEADVASATRQMVELLAEAGFAPHADAEGSRIELRRCPFRELAEADPDVVCGVHLGIMQGALAELGVPVEVVGLRSFVRPGLCVATLRQEEEPR
jgi:predicted ArsR family transcriptional regulator